MTNLALRDHLPTTPNGSATLPRHKLRLVEPVADLPGARLTRIGLHYLFATTLAISVVALLNWLAPTGTQRATAFAALAAASSFFLFAAILLSRYTWQRFAVGLTGLAQFLFALGTFWQTELSTIALLCLSGASVFMLYASQEHSWKSPGVFWFSFILGIGSSIVST